MTKKPEIVKVEDLIQRKDGLLYKNDSNYPYTGVVEYFKKNTIVQIRTFYEGLKYGELNLLEENPAWHTFFENGWQRIQEDIEDIYVFHEGMYSPDEIGQREECFAYEEYYSRFLTIRNETEGLLETYYENGQLRSKEYYKNGESHGPYELFLENGQLAFKINYINGAAHGPWEEFYENGQLKKKSNYKNGKERLSEYFYENGQLLSIENYKNKHNWSTESFYENGQLMLKGNYKNNESDGLWEVFDEEGNLTKSETWENGKLIE